MRFVKRCGLLLASLLALQAQETPPAASIEGVVTSDIVAVIPGATIRIDTSTRGYHRETTTNPSGYYIVGELPPGMYSISAEVNKYGCIIYPHIALKPGQRLRQDFVFVRSRRKAGGCEEPGTGK